MKESIVTNSKILTVIIIMFTVIVLNSCKHESKTEFLIIDNNLDSKIYTIIFGLPSENSKKEKDWIFEGIIYPDSSFIIENENNDFYLTSDEISPIYDINEYEEIEIFVFKGQTENYQYFTGKDRDTLFLEKYNLSKMILRPINVKIE